MKPDLRLAIEDFGAWHRSPVNRACHDLGLPAITIATLGALARVPIPLPGLPGIDLGLALLAGTLVFDLWLAWRLAPFVAGLGLGCWAIGRELAPAVLAGLFAVGWVLQLVGHRVVERNAPAFTDNLVHLVVGPRWLVNRWLRVM